MSSPPPDKTRSLWLFALAAVVYAATLTGITCSNDGSHYALVRSLVDRRSVEVSSFAGFTEGNDLARKDGELFTDRPPGTAVLAAPLYALGKVLPSPATPLPSKHDAENPALYYLMLFPVMLGAGTLVVLYQLLRRWQLGSSAAFLTCLTVAFGTLHWKYSTVLFSHAASGFCLLTALWTTFRAAGDPPQQQNDGQETEAVQSDQPRHIGLALLAGLLAGSSAVVEYSNLPVIGVLGAFLAWSAWRAPAARTWKTLGGFGAGLLPPLLFLAWYNAAHFGAPWVTSYAYNVSYPWATSFRTTFDFPLLQGLHAMLFFTGGPLSESLSLTTLNGERIVQGVANQGLFLLSPVLLCAVVGLLPLVRGTITTGSRAGKGGHRAELGVTLGIALFYLLLFSTHHTFHGGMRDGRYLTPFIPMLSIPLAFFLQAYVTSETLERSRLGATLAFFGLLAFSIHTQALHIGYSYHYFLDPGKQRLIAADPHNWGMFLSAVFPGASNLPYALIIGVPVVTVMGLWRRKAADTVR